MGLKAVVLVLAATAVLAAPPQVERTADFLSRAQRADGGFAERRGQTDPGLTAWAVLALRAGGREPASLERAGAYLAGRTADTATELALRILALEASGRGSDEAVRRLEGLRRADGSIDGLVNSTAWGALALRAAGRPAGASTVRYLLRHQRSGGGWSWHPRGGADSNDTAAALQALRASGVGGRPIAQGLRFLRTTQHRSGGFSLVRGRAPDAQSTAWAVQAFLAAGAPPPRRAFAFLQRLRRPDGSYRYSQRYGFTPVWVTAQVLPALARRPYPLR